MTRNWSKCFQTLTLCILPILALTAGAWSAGKPVGILLDLAEPLLFAAIMTLLCSALLENKHALATSILAAGVVGAVALHQPLPNDQSTSDGPDWLRTLKGCAILSKPTMAPIRLFTWTINEPKNIPDSIQAILSFKPDIIILTGSDDLETGSRLRDALDGEVKFFPHPTGGPGITAVARGSFQYCGGESDSWNIPLSDDTTTKSSAIITFPHINKIGTFPLVITRFSALPDMTEWSPWAAQIIDHAEVTAKSASVIGTRKLVVMGNLQVPTHSAAIENTFRRVGLRPAQPEPNWPTSLWGLPFLPLHVLDHAWVGKGWHIQAARTLHFDGQDRRPILVDITPRSSRNR